MWIGIFLGGLVAVAALCAGRWLYRRRRYAEDWHCLVDPVPRLFNVGLLLFGVVRCVGLVQCLTTAGEPVPGEVGVA